MVTLSWTANEEAPERTVVFVSELRPTSWRALMSIMRDVGGVARQLREADGAHAYALRAQLLRRRLTTVSVWRDEAAVAAFVRAEPHRTVMGRHRAHLAEPRFRSVEVAGHDVVLDADDYLESVDAPTA